MGSREERVARNETKFREANETLRERWGERADVENALFICECGDPTCTELVRMQVAEYEAVRAQSSTFLIVPGHNDRATEEVVTGDVCDENERFEVVKKRDEHRHVTEGSDPRA